MFIRLVGLFAACALLAGCKTVDEATEKLSVAQSQNKGIVLISTSLKCPSVLASLARANDEGRYANLGILPLETLFMDNKGGPSRLALPPGRYGIIALNCPRETYTAKLSERRDIFLGLGDIYDKPIATFEVNAGEVVDIGHLELITGRSGAWGARSYKFAAVATPMAPAVLQKLAENYPDIYAARVTRLMTTPNNVQVRGQPASTPLR